MEESIKLPKLDHSQKEMYKAFGISFYQKNYVRTAILFETLATSMLVNDFYDKIEDVPSNMRTVSGIVEKSLEHLKTVEEQCFGLMIFTETYDAVQNTLKKMESEEEKEKEYGTGIEATLRKLVDQLKAEPLKRTMKVIKECNYDFDKFIEKVLPAEKADEMERMEEELKNELRDFLDDDESDL